MNKNNIAEKTVNNNFLVVLFGDIAEIAWINESLIVKAAKNVNTVIKV
jgi:hypothetical protein